MLKKTKKIPLKRKILTKNKAALSERLCLFGLLKKYY